MPDTLSPLLNLLLMGDGLHFNTWGDQLNTDLTTIENAVCGNVIIPVTAPTMTLSIAQTNAASLTFTGTLTANTVITLPFVSRTFVVSNQTSGSFSFSLQAGAAVPLLIQQGTNQAHVCYSDGQNVFSASQSIVDVSTAISSGLTSYLPPGAIQEFAMTTPPTGWLECNGALTLVSAQPNLFAAIGYQWGGAGLNFNLPDFRGTFRRAWDHGKGIDTGRAFASFQVDAFASHTHLQNPHTHTDAGHTHPYAPTGGTVGAAGSAVAAGTGSANTGTGSANILNATAVNQATGGTETTVKNYATLVCIRT
jgi:microcystin-dependent protein